LNKSLLVICFLLSGCAAFKLSDSKMEVFRRDNFNSISQPFSVKYFADVLIKGKINRIEGTIKINENKEIFINGFSSIYGVEVFKVLFFEDSIIFIDKINKKYFEGSLAELTEIKRMQVDNITLLNFIFGKKCFKNSSFFIDSTIQNLGISRIFYKSIDSILPIAGEIRLDVDNTIKYQAIKDLNSSLILEYVSFMKSLYLPQNLKMDGKLSNFIFNIEIKYSDFKAIKDESFVLKAPNNFSKLK